MHPSSTTKAASMEEIQIQNLQRCANCYRWNGGNKPEEGSLKLCWANKRVVRKGFFSQAQSIIVIKPRVSRAMETWVPFSILTLHPFIIPSIPPQHRKI